MSTQQFACPKCQQLFQVSEEMAGRKGRCTACGTIMTIPMPGELTQPETEPPITLAEMSAEQTQPGSAGTSASEPWKYKNCPYCAEEILAEARLCKHCGNMLAAGGHTSGMPVPGAAGLGLKTNGFAIASLVLGLIPLTCLPSILAIIFGHIA